MRKPFLKSEITFKKSENKRFGDSFRKTCSARKAFLKSENKMMSDSYGSYIIYNQVDYAHHITARPPGFENPAASLLKTIFCLNILLVN